MTALATTAPEPIIVELDIYRQTFVHDVATARWVHAKEAHGYRSLEQFQIELWSFGAEMAVAQLCNVDVFNCALSQMPGDLEADLFINGKWVDVRATDKETNGLLAKEKDPPDMPLILVYCDLSKPHLYEIRGFHLAGVVKQEGKQHWDERQKHHYWTLERNKLLPFMEPKLTEAEPTQAELEAIEQGEI